MTLYKIELVLLDGNLFVAFEMKDFGILLVHPKHCSLPPEMKFKSTAGEHVQEKNLISMKELLDISKTCPTSRRLLVKHRGILSLYVSLTTKSYILSLPVEPMQEIIDAAHYHYDQNNFWPIFSVSMNDVEDLTNFKFIKEELVQKKYSTLFQNHFFTELNPTMKLKSDLLFSSSSIKALAGLSFSHRESKELMIESPQVYKKTILEVEISQGDFLGEGTFGQVFEIKKDQNHYALKYLKREAREDFGGFLKSLLSETSGLCSCAEFYDVRLKDTETIHIIMPLYGPQNLEAYISNLRSNRKKLHTDQLLGIFRGLAKTLRKLHCKGMAHLDVKMSNIIGMSPSNSCELIDFGLSSLQEGPQKDVLKITLDTRDPVVIEGKECFTWSDIWSMGIIFSDLVHHRRLTVVPYMRPGIWPNGKPYDWKKEEKELALKFIGEKINDNDTLGEFLLNLLTEEAFQTLSLGTALILSNSLWNNPGKRSSFQFFESSIHIGLEKWPYPVFAFEKTSSLISPKKSSPFFINIQEIHMGHYCLDGSGPFESLHNIPPLHSQKHKVFESKRRFQLQFIASLLLDLREFNIKTFLLSVDILDRVSTPLTLQNIEMKFSEQSLFVLEVVCVYFAILQSCPLEPQFEYVLEKAIENLPYGYTSGLPSKESLWTLFLALLSTVKFKQHWEDSLWSLVIQNKKVKSPAYLRGLLESLQTWPDGYTSPQDFISNVKDTSSCSYLGINVPAKKLSAPLWITPEFQYLICQEPFLEAYVHSEPLSSDLNKEPGALFTTFSPSSSSSSSSSPKSWISTLLDAQQERLHPFYIPLPESMLELSRKKFDAILKSYMKHTCSIIPESISAEKRCIACTSSEDTRLCSGCKLWHVCKECSSKWEGRCSQCLFPSETKEWKKVFEQGYGIHL